MTADAATTREVGERVERLSRVLDAHAGGLELVDVEPDGAVNVRFTGMCTGCPLRPVTLAGLIRPALLDLEGVEAVRAEGGRMSAVAEARMAEQVRAYGSHSLLDALTSVGANDDPLDHDDG